MSLAAVDLERQRFADAEPHARQAVAIYERLVAQWPRNTGYAADLLGAQTNLANLYQATKRPDEATAVYTRALAVAERLIGEQPDNPHHATALAALCINRGNLDKDGGRPRDALAWYERSIRSAERALARDGRLAEARTWLEYAHGARAQAHEQLRDYAAAVRDWDRVVELTKAEDRHVSRLLRVAALARAGAYDRTASEVDALAAAQPNDQPTLWHLAGCCAAASAVAAADEQLSTAERPRRAEALAVRGVELLRQVRQVMGSGGRWGFLAKVATDPDLKPLHGREDFKALLRESLMNWPQMNTDKHR
jgi:tetratricopeptide (TPR) repeat protein